MRGKYFFLFLCHLILNEAGKKEQISQGKPSNSPEASLSEIFSLVKILGSIFNSNGDPPGLESSALVVIHGAYMRRLFGYILTDLKCSLAPPLCKSEVGSVSPNTGISLFNNKLVGSKKS